MDVKSVEGKEFCLNAAINADVLIEGFRPGVMERLGLGPDQLTALNEANLRSHDWLGTNRTTFPGSRT